MTVKHFKNLPHYLQPRIISAVSYIHRVSPDIAEASKRINKLARVLSQKELMYVISLLAFDKLLDMVADSDEFKKFMPTQSKRTVN